MKKRIYQFHIPNIVTFIVLVSVLAAGLITLTHAHATASPLKVQYMPEETSLTTTKIEPELEVVNTGSSSVSLSQLTIRYWFTRDTAQAVSATCNYATMGCSNITEKTATMPQTIATTDDYLQIGFASGELAANTNSGKIKIRAYKSNYSHFDQSNDYSFNRSFTSFTDWPNVTLYQNGTLVWGIEPTSASATPTPTQGVTPTPTQGVTPTPTLGITPTTNPSGSWTGTFNGFSTTSWVNAWNETSTHSWGLGNLTPVSDPTSPNGQALQAYYAAHSSSPSCGCASGGGQFYTLSSQLSSSSTIDLKYYVKFPTNYDWGKAGKLPGLYGGQIGCESGGVHCNGGWSTRYMWRGNSGELYFYSTDFTGYGQDYGLGNWHFSADNNWHSLEQLVNVAGNTVTVWYDGVQVLQTTTTQTTGMSLAPLGGIFFSTFYGGHDPSWGPQTSMDAYFADFSLSTSIQH